MSLQGTVSGCIPVLLLALFFVNFSYVYVFGLLFSGSFSLALTPLIVSAFAFVWTCFSLIWLWQYWLRPDWSPWRIILTAVVNLSLSLLEFYSVRWKSHNAETVALASLIVTGVNAALQTLLATCLYLLRSRSYEPLLRSRSRITTSCLCQRSTLDTAQGAVVDQLPSRSRNMLQLERLYKMHEDARNEHTDKFSKAFAPHIKTARGPQFDPFLDSWANCILWNHLDFLMMLIILYLCMYLLSATVPHIAILSQGKPCDTQCQLQIAVTLPLGLWTPLVLYLCKRGSHFGRKMSLVNIRLATLLSLTFFSCVVAGVSEILYTLITSGMDWLHRGLGMAAGVRVGVLVFLCCFRMVRRAH